MSHKTIVLVHVPVDADHPVDTVTSVGLAYLHASLIKAGFSTTIYDFGRHIIKEDDFLSELLVNPPLLIGFSVTSAALRTASNWIHRWKSSGLKCPFVLGGAHPTVSPTETILQTKCDYVLRGEAEESLPLLVKLLAQGIQPHTGDVPGLVVAGCDNSCLPDIVEVADIDTLPWPARALQNSSNNVSLIPIVASRGCIYKCRFCYNSDPRRSVGIRHRNPEDVIGEIRSVLKCQGKGEIFFLDDCFSTDRAWASKMAENLGKLGVQWAIQARAEEIADGVLVGKFARNGCKEIYFGIETLAGIAARLNNKSYDGKCVRAAVKACVNNGVSTRGNFMIGFPEDTLDSIRVNIREGLELGLDKLEFMFVTPYPGSKLSLDPLTPLVNWLQFNPSWPICLSRELNEEMLLVMYRYAKTAAYITNVLHRFNFDCQQLREVIKFWKNFILGPPFSRIKFLKWQGVAVIDGIFAGWRLRCR